MWSRVRLVIAASVRRRAKPQPIIPWAILSRGCRAADWLARLFSRVADTPSPDRSDCPFSCRLIRAKVFPRSVCVADVYVNSEERQDACPLGRVFCMAESVRGYPSTLTLRGTRRCKLVQHIHLARR